MARPWEDNRHKKKNMNRSGSSVESQFPGGKRQEVRAVS